MQGSKATFLRHASHRPALSWRDGVALSLGAALLSAVHVRTCLVTRPFHYRCSRGQDWSAYPHPRAKSPCHRLTVGWPPPGILHVQSPGTVGASSLTETEPRTGGLWILAYKLTHSVLSDCGDTVLVGSCPHAGSKCTWGALLTTPRETAGCGLRGCW